MELIELDATAQRALELLTNAGMSDGSIYDYRVYAVENHAQDSRVSLRPDNTVQTLAGRMGTGGGNVPLVLVPCFGQASYDEYAPTEQAVTLKATGGNYGGGY